MRRPVALASGAYLILVCVAIGADKPKSDLDAMQGKWKVTAVEMGGRQFPPEFIRDKETIVVIEGDKRTETVKGRADPIRAIVKLDPSKTPKQIDLVDAEPEQGKPAEVTVGIYEIQGDTLKECIARGGADRPKEFKGADKNTMYRVLTRIKP